MSYFEEEAIRRRVVQRIRRRFLFALHLLGTIGVAVGHIYYVHSHAVRLQETRSITPYFQVGGSAYWTSIGQVLGVLGIFLLAHLVYFAYREILTRALNREMTQAYGQHIDDHQDIDKRKRSERLMLSEDGELRNYEQEDLSEYQEQWQRN